MFCNFERSILVKIMNNNVMRMLYGFHLHMYFGAQV